MGVENTMFLYLDPSNSLGLSKRQKELLLLDHSYPVVLGRFLVLLGGVMSRYIEVWSILAVCCVLEESGKFGEVLLRVAIFNIVLWL